MANYIYLTGKILWAKILGDPVDNYNKDGKEWTMDFVPDAESLTKLIAHKLKEKIKGRGYNIGTNEQYSERDPFIRLVQKEFRANGKRNDPITVVDARNRLWDPDVKIGNDSFGEVKLNIADYGKGKPMGLYPQALRVLEHKVFIREEFAPLPEDNQYVQNFAEDVKPEMVEVEDEGDPLEGQ